MTAASVSVGSGTAVQLASGLKHVTIQNLGPYNLAIGGSAVTFTTGLLVPVGSATLEVVNIGLTSLESLYGITDPSSGSVMNDVRVLSYVG